MNKTNLLIQAAVMLAVVILIIMFAESNIELFRQVMLLIGGWQIGQWVGIFTTHYWPVLRKETK